MPAMAQTSGTLTQVWRINGGTESWFPATVSSPARTVRSADYFQTSDVVVISSRSTPNPGLVVRNAVDGSTVTDIFGGVYNYNANYNLGGAFASNMLGVSDDNIIYVGNLVLNAGTTNFVIYRHTAPELPPTVAFNATIPALAGVRVGDTLAVAGSGVNTEIWCGTNANAGPHLVKFTTTDGLNYTVAATLTATAGSFTPFGGAPARLGLSIEGIGASAILWGDTSGPNDIPRRFDATTAAVTDEVSSTLNAWLGSACTVGVVQLDGRTYLASGPGNYSITAAPAEASKGNVFDVTTLGSPVAYGQTVSLGIQDSSLNWYPNGDGTGGVFFDVARRRVGFMVTNNSISMHSFFNADVADWNLH